ncbi:TRAP transporter large permease subunit [Pseudooceanicola sp. 216_PA32_1]|uniref:TRAP transporter large permease subunit n=2 Tax=Pseudooceanicola pacificus TaxID=2676438 RepID=A0A844WEH4_9RHOB|nr:TRAP transporter large permease subunit [Pseudooceanicola pacificus]
MMSSDTERQDAGTASMPRPAMQAHPYVAGADAALAALNRTIASAGVVLMLAVALFTVADVIILRAIFNAPFAGSNEVFTMLFSVAIAAVLASGISDRATLQIDILDTVLPERVVNWLRAIGSAIYLVMLVLLFIGMIEHTMTMRERGIITTILQMPTWPFMAAVTALLVLTIPAQLLVFLDEATRLPGRFGAVVIAALIGAAVCLGAYFGVLSLQSYLLGSMLTAALGVFVLLWIMILFFVPLSAAMLFCAGLGITGTFGFDTAVNIAASETSELLTSADLAIIPLFLMMGGFAVASGMSGDIYRFAHALFAPFRGGLAMATVGGCAGFGALTGSSVATVASIGGAAYPEMQARGYARTLATGSIAAGGTLGQLIPPSTAIVVYALLVEESIGTMYIAVLVPALLTILFYMSAIALQVYFNPAAAPSRSAWDRAELWGSLLACGPAILLFALVIGGIFFGIFTATEAAAVGAILAFLVALWRGKLSGGSFWRVASETTRSTSMIYFVIIGALVITFFMASTGVAPVVTGYLLNTGLPPLVILFLIAILFVLLGSVMDSMTIMMITASTMAGVITGLGYDQVWWGIVMVMLVELGVVTPPFGLNLFVMKSVAPDAKLSEVYRGVMPFVLADVIKIALLILIPGLTLWLPSLGQ